MRNIILMTAISFFLLGGKNLYAQKESTEAKNCFEVYEEAFKERGSYAISDNIYRNVMIAIFEGDEVYCVRGKVRVSGTYISAIFYYYDDNTEVLYDKKFHNLKGEPASITNGISEMIINADRERFRIVFIDSLKPKKKQRQTMQIPDDI